MDIVTVLIGVVIAGLGIAGLVVGGKALRQWRQLSANDPVPINQAITASGTVEVEGDIRGHDSTLESVHFGEDCVAYEYEVEKRRHSSNNSGSNWRTIDSGQAFRPFVLEDESGTAYVDPEGALFSLEKERTRKTNAQGEPVPDDGSWNLNVSANIPGLGSVGIGNKRYTEKRLDVGGHCYAVGTAERPPAGVDADVAIVGTGAPTFMLSDATEKETRMRLLMRGAGYALAGLAASAFGVVIVGAELL
ncbi:GIDE domain-containing protein [Halostagnicola sp. A-GB9-2]|uniref:GIDE domain-containing protein n=1 Tax=Halostagnicola sp. A-GB9-2 TaxID=3048066 RepID=UPI0024C09D94|nr:GIDE domain-containing protein [Halostagnicola sp. A-GB9-2]MDJ1432493.1 GIDE domain-containing protein [Halostagnicola sp. A-GB9-2]